MHKPSIQPMVWNLLYSSPRANDPVSLHAHVTRYIVPEVRMETLRFYGPDGGLEAQYPGLDYSNDWHRKRLSSYQHHRQLFKVLDELRLTTTEIKSLCRWEGSLYARERYEREHDTRIQDSSWPYDEPVASKIPTATFTDRSMGETGGAVMHTADELMSDVDDDGSNGEDEEEDTQTMQGIIADVDDDDNASVSSVSSVSSTDEVAHSVGVALNQRLVQAAEARARGEDVPLDEDWEQWLKEAAERFPGLTMPPSLRRTSAPLPAAGNLSTPSTPSSRSNPTTRWGDAIPEIFRRSPSSMTNAELAIMRARLPPPPPYINPAATRASVDAALGVEVLPTSTIR
ncbi:hypothetical protein MMC25_003430 [Agyrium rufum]|nr:hypothetical protein [Agyrium rufum]